MVENLLTQVRAKVAGGVSAARPAKQVPQKTAAETAAALSNDNVGYVVGATSLLALAGFVIAYFFARFSCTQGHQLSTAFTLIIAGSAALITGVFVGFLFGIPRYAAQTSGPLVRQVTGARQAGATASSELVQVSSPVYSNNTNLEQVSDWLTKTLLGVALTQLSDIRHHLVTVATRLLPDASCTPNGPAFAACLLVFFFGCGFFFGYLMTALKLGKALNDAQESLKDEIIGQKTEKIEVQQQQLEKIATNIRNEGNVGGSFKGGIAELVASQTTDPHKDQWGGLSQANGYTLSATVKELTPDIGEQPAIYSVVLSVTDQQHRPGFETTDVSFHLHPSFVPDTVKVVPKNGVATYSTRAWGAFTVGVEIGVDGTKLELDLANSDSAFPELFKQR